MIDSKLIDSVAESISTAIMVGYVENDRIEWSVDGLFERSKWKTRTGTVTGVNGNTLTVIFDDETRKDMMVQKISCKSSIRRIES
jgi:ribosomal protein L21E